MATTSRALPEKLTLQRIHQYVLVFLVASLSVTVLLKIGEIQYLELLLAADFVLLLGLFMCSGWQMPIFRPYLDIAKSYGLFLVLVFLLGAIALRQDFFPVEASFFKRPLLLTVSRMAELFLDVFYMLYLASLYREDERICRFGAKTYYWVGIAGCFYSLASYPLNVLYDMQLGTYADAHRFRGFNNEAGSYGTYLISVCLLTVAMYHRNWLTRPQFWRSMPLLLFCMAGSQSKAALFAATLLGTLGVMQLLKGWKRWAMIGTMCAVVILVTSFLGLQAQIDAYFQGAAKYQEISTLRSDDANVVMGRVSGAVLAPRMIAAHPWLGIGWGNYPLVRDDPQYRQGSAFALSSTDSPSLGPIDYIVELGFPLWLYMTWISLKPAYLLRRRGTDIWLVGMALIQPVSNWFGAHLNITYPWVVLGLALGMGYGRRQERASAGVAHISEAKL
jgi:hypothetical protein